MSEDPTATLVLDAPPAPALPVLPAPAPRVCVFRLGGALFAVDVRHAREVLVLEELTAVPRAPAHVVGVTNLRGYILPVLDARPRLGLATAPVGRGTPVLVVGAGAPLGIVIEAALGLATADEILPLGDGARREYGRLGVGLVRGERGLTLLLDGSKLLDALRAGVDGRHLGGEAPPAAITASDVSLG